jgi:DNA replication protein DnaC
MSTATETQHETTCEGCGKTFAYTPASFKGVTIPPPPKCDECEDRDEAQEAAAEREERARRAFESRVERARFPKTLRGIAYPENTPAVVRSWGAGEVAGVYLTGPFGVGKTWLAAAAGWERLRREPVKWVSVTKLVMQAKMFGESASIEAKQTITGSSALILDDIDKMSFSDHGRELLFTLVETRYQAGAPIFVTANLTVGELSDRIGGEVGGSIASRLSGHCEQLLLDGDDRRLNP